MGACFSKKEEPATGSNEPNIPKENRKTRKKKTTKKKKMVKAEKENSTQQVAAAEAEATPPKDKMPVFFVVTNGSKQGKQEKPKQEVTKLVIKSAAQNDAIVGVPKAEEARTSSCAKEELDATLVQCGRLGRYSTGKKRSYDFDHDDGSIRDGENEDWEKKKQQQSKSSPCQRTPGRERGGQRRVSGSPVRRLESPAAAASSSSSYDKSKQQPTKMVPVPAREKRMPNAAPPIEPIKAPNVVANRRNAAPRLKSPVKSARVSNENALAHHPTRPQPLIRNSPKKVQQSPCRRKPMTKIDDNSINRAHRSKEGEERARRATQIQTEKKNSQTYGIKRSNNCDRDRLPSCREKKQLEAEREEEAKEPKGASSKGSVAESLNQTRVRASRRSSIDFDNNNLSAATYTSLLLEDIHNYHQRNVGFPLPACVYKARSILEAVADLNSSSSDQSNHDNGRSGKRLSTQDESFVESEIAVKDDLMEPTLHKYITVRDVGGEREAQESGGSNSLIGQHRTSSWELNSSVDSTDRFSTSQLNIRKEVDVEQSSSPVGIRDFDVQSGGPNSNSIDLSATVPSSTKDRRQLHQGGNGGNRKGGSRAYSAPVAATASQRRREMS